MEKKKTTSTKANRNITNVKKPVSKTKKHRKKKNKYDLLIFLIGIALTYLYVKYNTINFEGESLTVYISFAVGAYNLYYGASLFKRKNKIQGIILLLFGVFSLGGILKAEIAHLIL